MRDEHSDVAPLRTQLENGLLEPYLRHIRFPRFRNLAADLQIDFTFPVTAIVGINGTNKSSILRALQGSVDYSNIGEYWFGTAVDPIEDGVGENRIRFIHGWRPESVDFVVEAVKQREASGDDPDYFEPARPRDGMSPMPKGLGVLNVGLSREGRRERSATRWNPIPKEVEYIDFRSELSAFDKYFFHNTYRRRQKDPATLPSEIRSRKSLIRDRSPALKRAIEKNWTSYRLGRFERIHTPCAGLSEEDVQKVSTILGREYQEIALIEHSLFNVRGWTARLRSAQHTYSEAFAGSGEFAVVRLVHRLSQAQDRALVLLDEPEVSLHPRAQLRLVDHLLDTAKRKHLQIIYTTHSPNMLDRLPPDAIKVLDQRPDDGRFELRSQESLAVQAFRVIGHDFSKPTIWVEDRLAEELVRRALRVHHPDFLLLVDVRVHPGGESDLKVTTMAAWALTEQTNAYVVLDGDQDPGDTQPEHLIADADLEAHVLSITGGAEPRLARDSGEPPAPSRRAYLRWWAQHVRFLPEAQPERLLLKMIGEPHQLADVPDAKEVWVELAWAETGRDREAETINSDDIFFSQRGRLATVGASDPDLAAIASTVHALLS